MKPFHDRFLRGEGAVPNRPILSDMRDVLVVRFSSGSHPLPHGAWSYVLHRAPRYWCMRGFRPNRFTR